MNLYIKNKIKSKIVIVYIKKNVHIVNNFKIKILINIDIMCLKKIIVDFQTQKLMIKNCKITIFIICISIEFKVN